MIKSSLFVSLDIKTRGSEFLLFSEFINIVSIFYALLNRFDYVIVYFFSDLFRLIQRRNNLPDFI